MRDFKKLEKPSDYIFDAIEQFLVISFLGSILMFFFGGF